MIAFAMLGVLEWTTLSPETIRVVNSPSGQPLMEVSVRGVALAVLAMLALRSWVAHRHQPPEEREEERSERMQ